MVVLYVMCLCNIWCCFVGILESIPEVRRKKVQLIAMCFPTPRDKTTDRANALFHTHVNLSPQNKYVVCDMYSDWVCFNVYSDMYVAIFM